MSMIRHAIISLVFLSAPALAADHYRAEPVAPPAQERLIIRDNIWRCAGEACTSGRSAARPAIVCATLVRQVGALRSFSVEGRAFAAEDLATCNQRAR